MELVRYVMENNFISIFSPFPLPPFPLLLSLQRLILVGILTVVVATCVLLSTMMGVALSLPVCARPATFYNKTRKTVEQVSRNNHLIL